MCVGIYAEVARVLYYIPRIFFSIGRERKWKSNMKQNNLTKCYFLIQEKWIIVIIERIMGPVLVNDTQTQNRQC